MGEPWARLASDGHRTLGSVGDDALIPTEVLMPTKASKTVPAKTEAIKAKIAQGKGRPQAEWRVDGEPGLVLITRQTGVGVFFLIYRPKHGGKQRKLRLGEFPATTLAAARSLALEARAKIDQGADPAIERSALRASETFEVLAKRMLAEAPLSAKTRKDYADALGRDAYPVIGSKPSALVTPDDVHEVCRRPKERGAKVQAQRTKAAISSVYRWAIKQRLVKRNPGREAPNQLDHKPVPRTRVPTEAELAKIWREANKAPRLSTQVKLIIKLAILTGQRRTEVAGARVAELDLEQGTWTIAASVIKADRVVTEGRMKGKRQQTVYLSTQAAKLFGEALTTCSDGVHLFAADDRKNETRTGHISGESVSRAMARLRNEAGIDNLTIHDMRRAIGNFLKNNGIGREVRDLILHHKDMSVDGEHYSATATMEKQCRGAWQLWADHVSKVVGADAAATSPSASTTSTVVPQAAS